MTTEPHGDREHTTAEDPGTSEGTTQNLGSTTASGNTDPEQGTGHDDQAATSGHDETARNPNIDPDPVRDPSLNDDGDLEPGQTPPESNSATATPPAPAPTKPPKSNAIITVMVVAIVALIGVLFLGYIAGIIG